MSHTDQAQMMFGLLGHVVLSLEFLDCSLALDKQLGKIYWIDCLKCFGDGGQPNLDSWSCNHHVWVIPFPVTLFFKFDCQLKWKACSCHACWAVLGAVLMVIGQQQLVLQPGWPWCVLPMCYEVWTRLFAHSFSLQSCLLRPWTGIPAWLWAVYPCECRRAVPPKPMVSSAPFQRVSRTTLGFAKSFPLCS